MDKGGTGALHRQKGAKLNSVGIQAGGVRRGRCGTSRETGTQQGGQLHESEMPRALKLEKRVMGILSEPIWSRWSIALTYPSRSQFQRTLNRERWGQG